MVKGIEVFKEYFAEFQDSYVIIGGTACDILLRNTDMRPRVTDDIDMLLVANKISVDFGRRFWSFIRDGEYTTRQRKRVEKDEVPELYRFIHPKSAFPVQIELLSKQPELLGEPHGFHLTPIPLGDDLSSLSAILLDEEFYNHTVNYSLIEEGVRIASPVSLLCLKVKAFLNLSDDKKQNSSVRRSDIKKHRDDVFKLFAMRIDPFVKITLPLSIKESIALFVAQIEASLPNKSLEDSLQRTDSDVRGYLDLMKEVFL
jgi:hypothetical protein